MARSDSQIGGLVSFEIDADQHDRALAIVASLRKSPTDRKVVGELIDLVLDLTDTGLAYFFLYPLELVGLGAIRRKGVEVALGTAGRVLPSVIRNTIGSMSEQQLLEIADFIEHMVSAPIEE